MKGFHNLSVATKLSLTAGINVFILVLICVVAMYSLNAANADLRLTYESNLMGIQQLLSAEVNLTDVFAQALMHAVQDDPAGKAEHEEAIQARSTEFKRAVNAAKVVMASDAARQLADQVLAEVETYMKGIDSVLAMSQDGTDLAEIDRTIDELAPPA